MAVPKKKVSKSKRGLKRSSWILKSKYIFKRYRPHHVNISSWTYGSILLNYNRVSQLK